MTEYKHKYMYRMAARNFEDKTAFIQTHFTHVINTENVQQDGGVETQIYLPVDGIKNIILKTKRHETCYRTKFIHGIKTTCCTCEFFNKLKLRLCLGVRTFETHQ